MVSDVALGIIGTLFGTVAGSIVGGWFGIKQTRIQQEAANKRHQADAFLDEKARRLSELYDNLIEATGLSSPHANKNSRNISEGLYITEEEINNKQFPSSAELLRAQKQSMLFISDEGGINRISQAVGLWLPILRFIESERGGPIRIRWEDVPVSDSARINPDEPLTHAEVQEISNSAIDVLRYEMHGPISQL